MFLVAEVCSPGCGPRLLLLRAGDVEMNPGPAGGEACWRCSIRIKAGDPFLRCVSGCERVSHCQEGCSGLKRTRQQRVRQGHEHWRCPECSGGTPVPTAPLNVQTSQPGQSGSVDRDGRQCLTCHGTLDTRAVAVRCGCCGREVHRRTECSGMTARELEWWARSGQWNCRDCISGQPTPSPASGGLTRDVDQERGVYKRNSLRIVHWNVNGILGSAVDFGRLLREENVDICMVQESKLVGSNRDPSFPGYTLTRRDRPADCLQPGGRGVDS